MPGRRKAALEWSTRDRAALARAREVLAPFREAAQARARRFEPVTVAERLAQFARLGYAPWGLYWPAEAAARAAVHARLQAIGRLPQEDARIAAYRALQEETAALEARGVPGAWDGLQAVARCPAQFRHVGMGRRAGKTYHAAHELLAVALARPRCTVWIAAPTARLVGRCFDLVVERVQDLQIPVLTHRQRLEQRLLVLGNGSRIEGVSLENILSIAGAAVSFVVIDEAAQITDEAWHRGIAPPLMDRAGQALLISSYEGEEGFFATLADQIRREPALRQAWAHFGGPSWDNFYAFPLGRETPQLQVEARTSDPLDFLEQYGAIPKRNPYRVYPEYQTLVHLEDVPLDPAAPVDLAIDPSGGANEYAVAVFQDYLRPGAPPCPRHEGGCLHQIDEFYVRGALAEDAIAWAKRQPWSGQIREAVIDGAALPDAERWTAAGIPTVPLRDKPYAEDRIPLVRRLLRDPVLLHAFRQARLAQLLAAAGVSLAAFAEWPPERQLPYLLQLEQLFADAALERDPEALAALRRAAHFRLHPRCSATHQEYRLYAFQRRRIPDRNITETPRPYRDHLMDATGYYVWLHHRHLADQPRGPVAIRYGLLDPPPAPDPRTPPARHAVFLTHLRAAVQPRPLGGIRFVPDLAPEDRTP